MEELLSSFQLLARATGEPQLLSDHYPEQTCCTPALAEAR